MKTQQKNDVSAMRSVGGQLAAFIMSFIVKIGFLKLTVEQKIVRARAVLAAMTGNPNFTTPSPTLADVTTAVDALELAQQNLPGGPDETEIRDIREQELDVLMSNLQIYVEGEAQGNPEIVLSSGMETRNAQSPIGILLAPETAIAKQGADEGSVKLKWKSVKKNSGYRVEGSTDPLLGWPMVYQAEKASLKVFDLVPGTKYYFRVATLSRYGYEGFSPVVTIRVALP
ncbi:MAG: fibronectin type III domain-containing protein [Bacteroidetes bacterium]|nr:fibronectin type III domain-containing protein [Bacteroidota bacterium]